MNERQELILTKLKEQRALSVSSLSRALFVSEATVRRDLSELQHLGLLRRTHGGAITAETANETALSFRLQQHAREKEAIARRALRLLGTNWSSLFLDSSSTALVLARMLDLSHKTVVTNNLESALLLSKVEGIEVIILGGSVYASGSSVKGSLTTSLLREFRFDVMITSCAAITPDGAYDNSLDQREVKRVAFERSARRFLLADHSKLYAEGVYLCRPLCDYDAIVLDVLPEANRAAFANLPIIV